MPYVGKKPADIIATAVDTTTGDFSGNVTTGGTHTVTGASILNGGIDVAGDFNFDVGGGDITLKDDGTSVANIGMESGSFILNAPTSDTDIIFKGNDGGSAITALTLDMSIGGVAKFGAAVQIPQYLTHLDDTDTFLEFGTDQIDLYAGNAKAVTIGSSQVIINQDSADIDFRVESNGNANMIFVDGGNDRVGIGTGTAPAQKLTVTGASGANVGGLTNGILALTTGDGGINDTRMLFGIVDDTYGWIQVADYGVAYRNLILCPNGGKVLVGSTDTSPATNDELGISLDGENNVVQISRANVSLELNRKGSDGAVVSIRQAGTTEGQISVSGTTVTYGGGHLGRLSRLLDNSKDTTIVKGTVMTNLDEMVEWKYEDVLWTKDDELPDGVSIGDVKKSAYTEDNEQLNKMAVSSVEGDANVSGVFVSWDDDDDFKDMMIAMTGDMVIRIAKDTTVSRGDLLMSAGDGTAKPQGDDIVRSKTIAKVTSTNKSHTYDDGTYLVPCVLMAC